MENKELVKLLTKTAKQFTPAPPSPKGPEGAKGQDGPKGPGGPPPEKKVLMLLNATEPEQPVPFVGMMAGIPGPQATKAILDPLAEQGLIAFTEVTEGERVKKKVTITDAGRAKVEADKAAFKEKMEAGKAAFKEKVDAKMSVLTDEEKETLAALLSKISAEE